jgi:hypothetical protein
VCGTQALVQAGTRAGLKEDGPVDVLPSLDPVRTHTHTPSLPPAAGAHRARLGLRLGKAQWGYVWVAPVPHVHPRLSPRSRGGLCRTLGLVLTFQSRSRVSIPSQGREVRTSDALERSFARKQAQASARPVFGPGLARSVSALAGRPSHTGGSELDARVWTCERADPGRRACVRVSKAPMLACAFAHAHAHAHACARTCAFACACVCLCLCLCACF